MMNVVMKSFLVLALVAIAPLSARADIILSVAQATPGDITLGSNAVFEVFAKTSSGTQNFNFLGFDLVLETTNGNGGSFNGTGTNLLDGLGWLSIEPYKGLYDATNSAGIPSFGITNTKIATITLSTSGAVAGTYKMLFENPAASTNSGDITVSTISSNYTLASASAVPEPTSIALVGIAGLGAMWRFRRRSFAS